MTTNLILALGIMIIAGFLSGAIAARFRFPRITGYLIAGILFSPSVFQLIPRASIQDLDIITSIALGIIAYQIGGSLHLESMRKLGKSIAWITVLQAITPWFFTTLVLTFIAPFIINIPSNKFNIVKSVMMAIIYSVARWG